MIQGDWNAKIGKDAITDWGRTSGKFFNSTTNERGYRLLEFAKTNDLIVANTFGPHKNQEYKPGIVLVDYIIIKLIIS